MTATILTASQRMGHSTLEVSLSRFALSANSHLLASAKHRLVRAKEQLWHLLRRSDAECNMKRSACDLEVDEEGSGLAS